MKRILRVFLVFILSSSLVYLPALNTFADEGLAFPSGDLIAPEIKSPPITEKLPPGERPIINAIVTDNVGVHSVTIFYRDIGETNFQRKEMALEAGTDNYSVTLPAIIEPGVEYYIQATDQAGNTLLHGHTFSPLTVNTPAGAFAQPDKETVFDSNKVVADKPEKGISKWVWIGLGVLAVAALASGDDDDAPETGSIVISAPPPSP